MSEHTKTPWVEFDYGLSIADKDGFMVVTTMNSVRPIKENRGNVHHIVHCVNNYERLVEALREVADELDSWHSAEWAKQGGPYMPPCEETKKARALLDEISKGESNES